jgi:hypothetical protein
VTAVPDALVVAESEPQPFAVAQESDHVTPLLALSFATVAVKVVAVFTATVAVVGATVTATAVGVEPPPPGGGVVVVLELPPQPAKNAAPNRRPNVIPNVRLNVRVDAATAQIRGQLRCLCARTMTLLPSFGPDLGAIIGPVFGSSCAQFLVLSSRLPGKKAAFLRAFQVIAADTLRQLWRSPLLHFLWIHAAVGNRDFPRDNGTSL